MFLTLHRWLWHWFVFLLWVQSISRFTKPYVATPFKFMHSQPKQWHRTKKTDQILKEWEKQQLVHFTPICCFWPAICQSLLWSWRHGEMRWGNICQFTLTRCYIWVHPSFLWFTAGSLDTSDALSRTFCATFCKPESDSGRVDFINMVQPLES